MATVTRIPHKFLDVELNGLYRDLFKNFESKIAQDRNFSVQKIHQHNWSLGEKMHQNLHQMVPYLANHLAHYLAIHPSQKIIDGWIEVLKYITDEHCIESSPRSSNDFDEWLEWLITYDSLKALQEEDPDALEQEKDFNALKEQIFAELKQVRSEFSNEEWTVLKYSFGMDNTIPCPLEDIAMILKTSEDAVKKIKTNCLAKLKGMYAPHDVET